MIHLCQDLMKKAMNDISIYDTLLKRQKIIHFSKVD